MRHFTISLTEVPIRARMTGKPAQAGCSIKSRLLIVAELSLGAGGAITWLSNPEGEWDEVLTKVKSVVGTVQGV